MNSWEESACYPRSTFYPLSDGPSIQNHRITMTWFPTCSTRRSRSQAPLCHCTRRLVSNQPEGTFARLRYFLGGDRPSQTPHQPVSSPRFTGSFRLAAGKLHLHSYFNFAESLAETVRKSLRHSCRSELTRQGISLP